MRIIEQVIVRPREHPALNPIEMAEFLRSADEAPLRAPIAPSHALYGQNQKSRGVFPRK